MANRRMFARSVTSSGRFLRMSPQARLLYYDLGMEADDDGFAEGFARLAATRAEEEHLFELEQRGFITIPDRENLVVHITDWEVNNQIRKDRYTPSVYRSVYPQCVGEAPVEKTEPQQAEAPAEAIVQEESMDNHSETNEAPDGCHLVDQWLTQDRLGKDRIGKDRVDQESLLKENLNQEKEEENEEANGAQARGAEAPTPTLEDIQTEFEKKKRKAMELLLNTEHFGNTRASPERKQPVQRAVNFL